MDNNIWYVYLLECQDNSYYTGVTTDINRRMKMHAEGKGSKYVYRKGFKKLIGAISCKDKSDACKMEYEIKQLPRLDKMKRFVIYT